MKIKFYVKVGDRQIQIEDDVANLAEFFRFMAMFDSLPQAGPAGQTDLKFSYRTPQGYEYYAIECPSAGKEFKFGQPKNEKTRLFPKEWAPIMHGRDDFEEEEEPTSEPPAKHSAQSQPPRAAMPSATAPPSPTSNVTDIDSAKYFDFQRKQGIDFALADEIRLACTVNRKTHWERAFEELRKLATPTGALTPAQMGLNSILAELRRLGVSQAELDKQLARICDGVCEVESLDVAQTAKAISVFQRNLDQKLANQRQQPRSA